METLHTWVQAVPIYQFTAFLRYIINDNLQLDTIVGEDLLLATVTGEACQIYTIHLMEKGDHLEGVERAQ